jgi:predicted nucleic acid-binding protein
MSGKVFVDTNVLIYAHDADAGLKRDIAARRLRELWTSRRGVLSAQVLQEFYVNVTRKIPKPLPRSQAREIIRSYAVWQIETIAAEQVLRASEIEERYQLSFWDALIVVAAWEAGADTILSEDMPGGQRIESILIENPFVLRGGA